MAEITITYIPGSGGHSTLRTVDAKDWQHNVETGHIVFYSDEAEVVLAVRADYVLSIERKGEPC